MATEAMPCVLREDNDEAARIIILANGQAMMLSQAQAVHAVQRMIEMLRDAGCESELIAQMAGGDFADKLFRYKKNQYEWAQLAR